MPLKFQAQNNAGVFQIDERNQKIRLIARQSKQDRYLIVYKGSHDLKTFIVSNVDLS